MADDLLPERGRTRNIYVVLRDAVGPASSGEIAAGDILAALWNGKLKVLVLMIAFAIVGSVYAFLAPTWYQAEVAMSPVGKRSLSGGLGQLGGLASLAGISIPGADSGEPLAVLKSRSIAREFIEDQKLMPILYADRWSEATHDWIADGKPAPDIRDAVQYFDESIRGVGEDKKSGMITLTIRWKDAGLAADWANLLVRRVNERMRVSAIHDSQSSINYLQKEMQAASVVSLQQSIGRVLESEMQKMALARSNEEFAFKVIDAATPPERLQSPKRLFIVVMSALFGAACGAAWVLVGSLGVSRRSVQRNV